MRKEARRGAQRPWFWQLEEEHRGPHWWGVILTSGERPEAAGEVLQRVPWKGHQHFRIDEPLGSPPDAPEPCDVWVNRSKAQGLLSFVGDPQLLSTMKASARVQDFLFGECLDATQGYQVVCLYGVIVTLSRFWGGTPEAEAPECTEDEGRALEALVARPGLSLQRWWIGYGGEGHPAVDVAHGWDADSLKTYLGPRG